MYSILVTPDKTAGWGTGKGLIMGLLASWTLIFRSDPHPDPSQVRKALSKDLDISRTAVVYRYDLLVLRFLAYEKDLIGRYILRFKS